jgi:LmbE family N-acetylglucosaminyl deacetylase
MAMMAHADDMEIYAGGTVAKFADQGYDTVLVMLTANVGGAATERKRYRQTVPEECMPIRDAEMRAGAAILGVRQIECLALMNLLHSDGNDFVWMGDPAFRENHPGAGPLLPAAAINPRLIEPAIRVIRKYEPEVVIGQHMLSGFEHLCAGHIVNQAFRQAMAQGASLGQLWLPCGVRECTWASDVRIHPTPNILIDISAYWDRKAAAVRAHKSQRLEGALENIRTANRYWGMARECELAEPFVTLCDARYR